MEVDGLLKLHRNSFSVILETFFKIMVFPPKIGEGLKPILMNVKKGLFFKATLILIEKYESDKEGK